MLDREISYVTPAIFTEMWTRERHRLVWHAGKYGIMGAEDLAHEAGASVWKRVNNPDLPPLSNEANDLYDYAIRAIDNKAIDAHRRASTRPATQELTTDPADKTPRPESNAELTSLWRIIRAELEDDKHGRVKILELYAEGYSQQEIAEKLDVPEGTIKSRLYYTRRKLIAAAKQGHFKGYIKPL